MTRPPTYILSDDSMTPLVVVAFPTPRPPTIYVSGTIPTPPLVRLAVAKGVEVPIPTTILAPLSTPSVDSTLTLKAATFSLSTIVGSPASSANNVQYVYPSPPLTILHGA